MDLIFDRNELDVQQANNIISFINSKGFKNIDENLKVEFLKGLKACYNISDVKRIQSVVKTIQEFLKENGRNLYIKYINVETNNYILTKKDFLNYLNNVIKLKESYYIFEDTPTIKVNEENIKLDYILANNIEKILFDILKIIECHTKKEVCYLNTFMCGEGVVI